MTELGDMYNRNENRTYIQVIFIVSSDLKIYKINNFATKTENCKIRFR